jgi:polyisoprenoid-binding protein YceI
VSETRTDHSRLLNHALVPPAGAYEIDPAHTFLCFGAQHLVIGHVRGYFEAVSGTVTVGEDPLASAVSVDVETASVTTKVLVRDDDLRSERYLDVARYPTMTYRSTGVSAMPAGTWVVAGDLTLRGVTRPLELTIRFGGAVTDSHGNVRLSFSANGSVTRSDFGLTFELLKEDGHLLVGKDVTIEIDVEAIRPLSTLAVNSEASEGG